jgi:hypothetical protein
MPAGARRGRFVQIVTPQQVKAVWIATPLTALSATTPAQSTRRMGTVALIHGRSASYAAEAIRSRSAHSWPSSAHHQAAKPTRRRRRAGRERNHPTGEKSEGGPERPEAEGIELKPGVLGVLGVSISDFGSWHALDRITVLRVVSANFRPCRPDSATYFGNWKQLRSYGRELTGEWGGVGSGASTGAPGGAPRGAHPPERSESGNVAQNQRVRRKRVRKQVYL